jgi:hypothetical protein
MQKLAIWAIDRRQHRDIMSLKFGMHLGSLPPALLRYPPGSNRAAIALDYGDLNTIISIEIV